LDKINGKLGKDFRKFLKIFSLEIFYYKIMQASRAFQKVAKKFAKFVAYFFIKKKFCHQPQKFAKLAKYPKSGHTADDKMKLF